MGHHLACRRRSVGRGIPLSRSHRMLWPGLFSGLLALVLTALNSGAATVAPAAVGPVHGGTLSLAWSSDMASFDPTQALIYDWQVLNGTLYDGLYQFDRTGQPQLDLAAAPPILSADHKTWTFTLRKGVRFSNGMELTARDVKFSITRTLDPHLKPAISWGQATDEIFQGWQAFVHGTARSVSGIQVLGRYTIRFVLTTPIAVFPDILAESVNMVVPQAVVSTESPEYFGSHPIGTGPFELQAWQKGIKVVFVRNPLYFKRGKPYLDRIIGYLNVAPSTIALKVEKGELDGFGTDNDITAADLQQARSDPTFRHYLVAGPASLVIYLTQNVNTAPLSSPLLRRAIAQALDPRRLIQHLGGNATAAHQLYVPVDAQYDPHLDQHPIYRDNPRQAAALVKASGYHGQTLVLTYSNQNPSYVALAPLIQQSLQQIGLTVSLRGVSGNAAVALSQPLKGVELSLSFWSIDYPDAYDMYSSALSCAANAVGAPTVHYCDATADSLVNQAELLPLGPQRDALLRQAQVRLLQSAVYVPLVYSKRIEMVSPKVGGYYYQPQFAWQFENYWVMP